MKAREERVSGRLRAAHRRAPARAWAACLLATAAPSVWVLGCAAPASSPLRLATTTSVKDSGLLDTLLPAFERRTGVQVGVVPVGTGLALELAERGEADAVITHDQAREERFVAAGHARQRRVFASSEFVLVGPPDDPAGVRGLDAPAAFARIASSGAAFASRGDSSGTHARELRLWGEVVVERPSGPAYMEVRAGMATTLRFADQQRAYTLADLATFLTWKERLRLAFLVRGGPLLENDYAVMVVDCAKRPGCDARSAQAFADWLLSEEARSIIKGFRRAGEPVFQVAAPRRLEELTVSAAVSLKEALGAIATAFEAAHPGVDVQLNLAASGDLQRQIEAGAPADVFISAAAGNMDALAKQGAIEPHTRRDIACNRLVVVTPGESSGVTSLADLASVRRIAIGNPETVPAGQYAREALRAGGLWGALRPRLIFAENVRQALEYVARGEVDASFVYATDAAALRDQVRLAFEVDPRTYSRISYPAAVVAASRLRLLGRRFVEFLAQPQSAATLAAHGFVLPPCEDQR